MAWSADKKVVDLRARMGNYLQSHAGETKVQNFSKLADELHGVLLKEDQTGWDAVSQRFAAAGEACLGIALPESCKAVLLDIFLKLQPLSLAVVGGEDACQGKSMIGLVFLLQNCLDLSEVDAQIAFRHRLEPLVWLRLALQEVHALGESDGPWMQEPNWRAALAKLIRCKKACERVDKGEWASELMQSSLAEAQGMVQKIQGSCLQHLRDKLHTEIETVKEFAGGDAGAGDWHDGLPEEPTWESLVTKAGSTLFTQPWSDHKLAIAKMQEARPCY